MGDLLGIPKGQGAGYSGLQVTVWTNSRRPDAPRENLGSRKAFQTQTTAYSKGVEREITPSMEKLF